MTMDNEAALRYRDAEVFLHQRGSSPVAHAFRRAEGVWAEDAQGHRFMDFLGNTCHNIGYQHPRLIAALKEQLDRLAFTPRGFTNEEAVCLAERLAAHWPYGPARALLGLSGTDAIEMALKLAFVATGRKRTLAFVGAWHGAALGALWVGGRGWQREGFPALEGCHHVAPYWQGGEAGARECRDALARALLGQGGFACLLAEPLASGLRRPPDWFWPEVEDLCRQSGTLLIFDEIPKGLGKTGRFFASEHYAVRPDMTVLGKSLGGAVVPLSAVIARADLNLASAYAIGHYTHQKNPFLARAGLTVLDIIEDERLCEAAATKGAAMIEALAELARRRPLLGEAHGVGLLLAVTLSAPNSGPALIEACFRHGLHLGWSDGGYLELSPPLTLTDADMERSVEILDAALDEVATD
jgi:4-aminobutyrate aminotransferase